MYSRPSSADFVVLCASYIVDYFGVIGVVGFRNFPDLLSLLGSLIEPDITYVAA
jgi:cytochrome c oxidase subunit IV